MSSDQPSDAVDPFAAARASLEDVTTPGTPAPPAAPAPGAPTPEPVRRPSPQGPPVPFGLDGSPFSPATPFLASPEPQPVTPPSMERPAQGPVRALRALRARRAGLRPQRVTPLSARPTAAAKVSNPGKDAPASWWRRARHSRVTAAVTSASVTALLLLAAREYAVEPFSVPTESMSGTLAPGDLFVAEKLSYLGGPPRRGDVVVFDGRGAGDPADGPRTLYVKRVVAVAGDVVACCDARGRLTVNGSPVWEPYTGDQATKKFRTVTVPAGHVFVLGDNRGVSVDSRTFGPVAHKWVVGRGVARVWPLDRVGSLTGGR